MQKKKMLWHTKGKPSEKELVLVTGLNEDGETRMDICPVGISGICSCIITKIKAWARIKDVRKALKDYEKFCFWRNYPENKPSAGQKHTWFLVACRSKTLWRKDKIVFETDTWDGKKFAMTDFNVLYYMPILKVPSSQPLHKYKTEKF